ncbi:MAG: methyltransferase domain-containing protein [Selenomonadaceae bacterium]|nr:methyltransferase domain-containing protein [Selenomonadaceae bacterium]
MKLHIGCGEKFLPGYTHVDARRFPHVDYVTDKLDNLPMFEDKSADEIYACHILEHFTRSDIKTGGVLKEWYRILKVGGILRIAVPDFEAIVEEYLSTKNLESVMGLLYGGQNYEYNFHYQTYDFNRLEYLLKHSGFLKVARYDWRDFLPEGYDDYSRSYLPHMDFEHGRLMSLNVIATK